MIWSNSLNEKGIEENTIFNLGKRDRKVLKKIFVKANKKALKLQKHYESNCAYEYRNDDDQVTGASGMFIMKDLLFLLKLKELLNKALHVKKRKSAYSVTDLIFLQIEQKIAGIKNIEESWKFQCDKPYLDSRGLTSYPCPQTFRDNLLKFSMENVSEIVQVNRELLRMFGDVIGTTSVTLLIDSKVITVYGNQDGAEVGCNKSKPGRKSYCLKICSLEEFGNLAVHVELCPGNEVSVSYFKDFFDECEKMLPKRWAIKEVKMDSGYYSEKVCSYLESKSLLYTISARESGRLNFLAHCKTDELWSGSVGDGTRAIDMLYKPETWKKERRFIVVKIYIGENKANPLLFEEFKWRTQVLTTNKRESAYECYYAYNNRAQVENVIKELEYGYNAFRQPTNSIVANTANALLGIIAYNLVTIAKNLFFPTEWKNKTVATIRNVLIQIPAVVIGTKRKIIHISRKYPFMETLKKLHENVTFAFIRQYAFE